MYKEQNPRKPIQVVQVYTKNTTERLFSSRWDFDKDFFFPSKEHKNNFTRRQRVVFFGYTCTAWYLACFSWFYSLHNHQPYWKAPVRAAIWAT